MHQSLSIFHCFTLRVYKIGFLLVLLSTITLCNKTCNDTNQLIVSNNPVQFNAFVNNSISKYCTLFVNSSTSDAISVNVLNSGSKNAAAYFYVEVFGNESSQSICPYVSATIDHVDGFPCNAIIRGSQFLFHFLGTHITIEIRTVDVPMTTCSYTQTEKTSCYFTAHDGKIAQEFHVFQYKYKSEATFYGFTEATLILNITQNMARCKCKCRIPCTCTLGSREWSTSCSLYSQENSIIRTELIVYTPTTEGVSFAHTGLHTILPNAFSGLELVKVLILEHNNIVALPTTICNNVPQLQILKLGHNKLTIISSDLFNGRCQEQLLWLELNNNLLTNIENGVLSFFVKFKALRLATK